MQALQAAAAPKRFLFRIEPQSQHYPDNRRPDAEKSAQIPEHSDDLDAILDDDQFEWAVRFVNDRLAATLMM